MNLSGTQLKDTYGNLVTTGTSAGSPTTGGLQNGDGALLTSVGIGINDPSVELEVGGSSNTQVLISTTSNTGNSQLYFGDSDSDTAGVILYRHNGDSMAFEVNDTERMRIGSGGDISFRDGSANEAFYWDASTARLGIGTQTPGTDLEVNGDGLTFRLDGTANTARGILLRNVGTATGEIKTDGNLDINIEDAGRTMRFLNGNTPRMTIDSSGNVSFAGSASLSSTVASIQHLSSNGYLYIKGGTGGLIIGDDSTDSRIQIEDNSNIRFETAGSEAMRIDSSGNVGIGTTSPDGLLNLAHQTSTSSLSDDASGYALTFNFEGATNDYGRHIAIRDAGGDAVSAIGGFDEGTGGATALYFATGNTTSIAERMRIDSSGNVGIGTTSPANDVSGLHISVASSSDQLYLERTGSATGRYYLGTAANSLIIVDDAQSTERLRILSDGGITFNGDTATANALDDYEEGTFDLTLGGSTTDPTTPVVTTARYTKIGNVVHYNIRFDNVDTTGASGNVTFSAFPFTTTSTNNASGSVSLYSMADFNGAEYIDFFIGPSSTSGELIGSRSNNSWVNAIHNAGSGRYLNASITVHVV